MGKGGLSVSWIDPVYDRTQADVDFAIKTIAEWIAANTAAETAANAVSGARLSPSQAEMSDSTRP